MDARRRRKLDRAVLLTATALLGGAMLAGCATPDTIDDSGGSTSGGSGSGTSEGGGTGGGGSTGGGGGNSGGGTGGGGTGGGGTGGGGTGGGGGGSAPKPAVYAFELPRSDESITFSDSGAYSALRESCDAGRAFLDESRPTEYGEWSYRFSNPRFAVLVAAGVAVCSGDREGGRMLVDRAVSKYGLAGLAIPENPRFAPGRFSCLLYREVMSVLEQRPDESFDCPAGAMPMWRTSEGDTPFPSADAFVDDPLTPDADESIPPTPKETGTPGETDPGTGATDGSTGGTDGTDGTGTGGTDGTGTGTDGGGGAETAPPTGGSG